jgi:hypothetical protein
VALAGGLPSAGEGGGGEGSGGSRPAGGGGGEAGTRAEGLPCRQWRIPSPAAGTGHIPFPEGREGCVAAKAYGVRGGGMWLRGRKREPGGQAGFPLGSGLRPDREESRGPPVAGWAGLGRVEGKRRRGVRSGLGVGWGHTDGGRGEVRL